MNKLTSCFCILINEQLRSFDRGPTYECISINPQSLLVYKKPQIIGIYKI